VKPTHVILDLYEHFKGWKTQVRSPILRFFMDLQMCIDLKRLQEIIRTIFPALSKASCA